MLQQEEDDDEEKDDGGIHVYILYVCVYLHVPSTPVCMYMYSDISLYMLICIYVYIQSMSKQVRASSCEFVRISASWERE